MPAVDAGSKPTDAAAPAASKPPPREIGAVTMPPGISKRLPQFLHVARAPCGGIFLEEIR